MEHSNEKNKTKKQNVCKANFLVQQKNVFALTVILTRTCTDCTLRFFLIFTGRLDTPAPNLGALGALGRPRDDPVFDNFIKQTLLTMPLTPI